MNLKDGHGRIANYLRIGVTDRCNLRCHYCMPENGIKFLAHDKILKFEEIIRISKILRNLDVNKVRITGGEPFVRKDIDMLIGQLAKLFQGVYITTNATLIEPYIPFLKKNGIAGLNISIDSLSQEKFAVITRRDNFRAVLNNIHKCIDAQIPIKLNIVVMQNVNDNELIDFIQFGILHNIHVRFIEAMPFNADNGNKNVFINADEIYSRINNYYQNIKLIQKSVPSSELKYRINGKSTFGIIPAYTRSLCHSCNRIRITPKGELLTCLYAKKGLNLRDIVRNSSWSDNDIAKIIMQTVMNKKQSGLDEFPVHNNEVLRSMTTIGG